MKKTSIALVQMRCGPDPEENFRRAARFVRDAAKRGAKIVCLPELFRSQYFCQTEDHANFKLAEEIPGPSTEQLGKLAGELGARHRRVAFRETPGRCLPQHRRHHRLRRQVSGEISQDAHPGRSALPRKILFRSRATLGFRPGTPSRARSGSASAGINGIRKPPGLPPCAARKLFFIRPPSGGIRRKRRNSARPNIPPGKRSSAATPSPTVVMLPSPTGSATKRPQAATGSNSGARVSFAARTAKSSPKAPLKAKSLSWPRSTGRSRSHRTHWPFLRDRRIDAYTEINQACDGLNGAAGAAK